MNKITDSSEKSAIPDISELDRIGQGEGESRIINPFWYLEESDNENSPLNQNTYEKADSALDHAAETKPANVTYDRPKSQSPESHISDSSGQTSENYRATEGVTYRVPPSHGAGGLTYTFDNESRGLGGTFDLGRSQRASSPKHVTFNIPPSPGEESNDVIASRTKAVDGTFDIRPPVQQEQIRRIPDQAREASGAKYGTYSEEKSPGVMSSKDRRFDRTFDTGTSSKPQQDQSTSVPYQATDDDSAKRRTLNITTPSSAMDSSSSIAGPTKSVRGTFDAGASEYQSYVDSGRSQDAERVDASWIELENSIYNMMKSNLNSIDAEFTPEIQLQYLRVCFEDMFPKAVQFEHFMSSVKYLIYEHLPNFSLQRQYSPACLLTNLRFCLNQYRRNVESMEMTLIQLNNQLAAKLEADAGRMEDKKKSIKELVLGYQERLKCANERAKNARQQTASLQAQLCEALERVQQLEDRCKASPDARSLLQERLASISKRSSSKSRSGFGSIEELEYMNEMEGIIASGDALYSSLQSRLMEEHASNERLRVALKEKLEAIACLQSELSSTTEESSHKSELLKALTEDVVESFETSLLAYLASTPTDDPTTKPDMKLTAWKEQLENSIKEKEQEIHALDQALVSRELTLSDLRSRLRRKQEKIGDLEQDCVTLSHLISQKQLEVDTKEVKMNFLNNNLTEMQSVMQGIQEELAEKQLMLTELKEEVTKKQKEIKTLEDFRAKFSANVSGLGFDLPQTMQSFTNGIGSAKPFYVPTMIGEDSKSFAKFNTTLPSTSTPLKSESCGHYRLKGKTGNGRHQFKKTITVKSPNRNDPLLLNVSLVPSESSEHLHCDIHVRDGQIAQGESSGPAQAQKKKLPSKTIDTSGRAAESGVLPPISTLSYLPFDKSLFPGAFASLTTGSSAGLRPCLSSNDYSDGQPLRRQLFPTTGEIMSSNMVSSLFPSPSYGKYSQPMPQAERKALEGLRMQPRKLFPDSKLSNSSNTNQEPSAVDDGSPSDLSQDKSKLSTYGPQYSSGHRQFTSAYTDTDDSSFLERHRIPRRTTK